MQEITEKEFKQLADFIQSSFGIHLKKEKKALLTGRLSNFLTEKDFANFTDYINYVIKDKTGEAAAILINKISTNHTFFMREADHFNFFKENVLPKLVQISKSNDLRVWSAGCSSGEEPYTLAMIIDEFFGLNKKWWDTKILATDISSHVLAIAQEGIYPNERLTTIPKFWKLNYFDKMNNEKCVIKPKIKDEVIYRKFNLMDKTFPFKKKFHVIFCRNVMIYFDNKTKLELIKKFYACTEPGGYLFIGHSESLDRNETQYRRIMSAVYRKEP